MKDARKTDAGSRLSRPAGADAAMNAMEGTCAVVEAVSVVAIGAFMKWDFAKDLFVPLSEQHHPVRQGELYIVYVYRDERTGRLVGSTRLDKYLDRCPAAFEEHQKVPLMIADRTELGYKVIINNSHWGLLYQEDVFQVLHYGQTIEGFIKRIRDDGKIDAGLQKGGYQDINNLSEKILAHLKTSRGFSVLSDKTPPETIYHLFGISKKQFKMAVGHLYKRKLVVIDEQGIHLSKNH